MSHIADLYKHLTRKIKYEAGNMTYPPILFWENNITLSQILIAWEETVRWIDYNPQHKLGIYVHIPFCETKCTFCDCKTSVELREEEYDKYLDYLEKECILFQDTFRNSPIDSIYFGGGTPTILSPSQLDRLYTMLKKYFQCRDVRQTMIESSPYTFTNEKAEILNKHGVNKITFGVQALDSETLIKNNRPQNFNDVKESMSIARNHGIDYINIDLMSGIEGQTEESFIETVEQLEMLSPTTIQTNYFLPTKNTNYVKQGKRYGISEILLRNKIHKIAKDMLDSKYNIHDILKKNLQQTTFIEENSSFIGLGSYAISHGFGSILYTKTGTLKDYRNFIDFPEANLILGSKISIHDEIINFLCKNLPRGVNFNTFFQIFGSHLESHGEIYKKIKFLIGKGIIKKIASGISFTTRSEYDADLCSKILYDNNVINKFIIYMKEHTSEFIESELKLKQFFYD